MFNNIFKKFQKNTELGGNVSQNGGVPNGTSRASTSGGVRPMGQHLQKKFARGIQYNMKIIIRGDRNVGKTCLFHRLQGDKFKEDYVASDEIQVASIQWNYNATDDIVKVEIWDIVDKGKKRDPSKLQSNSLSKDVKLKMLHSHPQPQPQPSPQNGPSTNNVPSPEECYDSNAPALDAEFVDVYKGTSGVIFLFDMTKQWTFEYVQRELRRCPPNLPVLILANHRDMGHHRAITADQVQGFIDQLLGEDAESGRSRTGQIRHAECSMRNGFGLRYLYKFFNLPYLHLQRETLLKQLDRNLVEIKASCQELDVLADSDEHNYDLFLELITNRRRQAADQLSAVPKVNDSGAVIPVPNGQLPKSVSVPANISKAGNGSKPNGNVVRNGVQNGVDPTAPAIPKPTPSIIIGANNPLPPKFQQQMQQSKSTNKSTIPKSQTLGGLSRIAGPSNNVKNIDDFIPEESDQFRKFLDEPNAPQSPGLPTPIHEEDSDDDEGNDNNPMVAKYQEELDPEDIVVIDEPDSPAIKMNDYILKRDKLVQDMQKSADDEREAEEEEYEEITQEVYEDSQFQNESTQPESSTTIQVNGHQLEEENLHEQEEELAVIEDSIEQCTTELTQLNCDDIDALESLYKAPKKPTQTILKLSSNLSTPDEASSEASSVKSTSSSSRKKKSTKKTTTKTIVDDSEHQEVKPKNAKKTLKTKNSTSKATKKSKKSGQNSEQEAEEAERRQLEAFLGGSEDNPKDNRGRDQNVYEAL